MAEDPTQSALDLGAGGATRAVGRSWLGYVTAGLNAMGTLLVFWLLVMLNADIGSRWLFNQPIAGVSELVALSFVAIVFLQVPHALRLGRLTVADTLFGRYAKAFPRAAKWTSAFYNLVGAALFIMILWSCLPHFERAWSGNLFYGNPGSFTAPLWPAKLVVLIGTGVMVLQFVALAIADARAALGRDITP